MAEVKITLVDIEVDGRRATDIRFEFDPPAERSKGLTPAQQDAAQVLQFLQMAGAEVTNTEGPPPDVQAG